MSGERFLWFLIFLILSCTGIWLIGSFVTWNLSWFYDNIIGRLIAVVFFGIAFGAAVEETKEY